MKKRKLNQPPRILRFLIRKFTVYNDNHSIAGDIEEIYYEIHESGGYMAAVLWYLVQAVVSYFQFFHLALFWNLNMLKNYFKISWRNLLKHKSYSCINIFGLTVGIACSLLIAVLLLWEISYNRFHDNLDQLYRVAGIQHSSDYSEYLYQVPSPVGPNLKSDFPEVLETSRIAYQGELLLKYRNKRFYENSVITADNSLFKMLSFPFIRGNRQTALLQPDSIVISESIASKYFGSEDPIGKTLRIEDQHDYIVTGIFKDVPKNSDYRFGVVLPWGGVSRYSSSGEEDWKHMSFPTFLKLDKKTSLTEINSKIKNIVNDHQNEINVDLYLQAFNDMHLKTYHNGMTGMASIYIFSFLGFFILLISCINFMNLASARSAFRFREIGVRKVVGGTKKHIMLQFYSESILLSVISLLFAIVIVQLVLNFLHKLTGIQLTLNIFRNWTILWVMGGITFLTAIMAGSYPAIYLSSFSPLNAFKGSSKEGKKSSLWRKTLIIVQLSVSIIFLITGLVATRQFDYLMHYNTGWEKENLIYLQMRGVNKQSFGFLKDELAKIPGIQKISAGDCLPLNFFTETSDITWQGKDPEERFNAKFNSVDFNYIDLLNLKLVAGRSFSRKYVNDKNAFIVNQSLARIIGKEPLLGTEFKHGDELGKIIGVVKDFNYNSLKSGIQPMFFKMGEESSLNYLLLRLSETNQQGILERMFTAWDRVVPQYPFEANFIDEYLYNMYNDEDALGKMMKGVTLFSLLITCLGLMSLISFITEKKKKEIGIRKVLGASVGKIVGLISSSFIKLIILSNLIALPLAYLMMDAFLKTYAFRTTQSIILYLISGSLISIIVLLTIIYQVLKAARSIRWTPLNTSDTN